MSRNRKIRGTIGKQFRAVRQEIAEVTARGQTPSILDAALKLFVLKAKSKRPDIFDTAIDGAFALYQQHLTRGSNNPEEAYVRFIDTIFPCEGYLVQQPAALAVIGTSLISLFEPVRLDFYSSATPTSGLLRTSIRFLVSPADAETGKKFAEALDEKLDLTNTAHLEAGRDAFLNEFPNARNSKWPVNYVYAAHLFSEYEYIWKTAFSETFYPEIFTRKFDDLLAALIKSYPDETRAMLGDKRKELAGIYDMHLPEERLALTKILYRHTTLRSIQHPAAHPEPAPP